MTLSRLTNSISDHQPADFLWVDMLTGANGEGNQSVAFRRMHAYLYKIAFNYLKKRQGTLLCLTNYELQKLAMLSEDAVQDFMARLVQDNYAMLTKYNGTGRFLSWSAQVLLNQMASEFRKEVSVMKYSP